jgi:putative tryptophan/tyrosine transport system substrate-binding protein
LLKSALSCYTKRCRPLLLVGSGDNQLDQMETRRTQSAARTLGLRLLVFNVMRDTDPTPALATLVEHRAGGIVVGGNVFLIPKYAQILSHAARFALPTIFVYSRAARAGGLLSYGQDTSGIVRRMGAYTGRILKGEKPGDLPVILPTKFEFVINMNTARALGLTIPTNLLVRADEVIE